MIVVTKTDKSSGQSVRVEIPEGKDPFAVCAAAMRSLGLEAQADYPEFAAIMEARKKNGSRRKLEHDKSARHDMDRQRTEAAGRSAHRKRSALPGQEDSPPHQRIPAGSAGHNIKPDVRGAAGEVSADEGGLPVVMGEAVGVRDTSRQAHAKLKWSGKLTAQQEQLMAWLRAQSGDATRQEIARGTGLGINCVAGRCRELLDTGVLVENSRRACRVTKETANPLRVA